MKKRTEEDRQSIKGILLMALIAFLLIGSLLAFISIQDRKAIEPEMQLESFVPEEIEAE